ncbi:hypothetical protein CARUB_v10015693mg [Capsella rubella]|uniref:SUN domain-containing protein n=1 Tax=Capsella rubella TaxID=81985 RepID=R0HRK6_9BRAS|nr:SUN domain-containing protein 2 [Capsella rubella]EOA32419.1 hypothetical protein CARUB_v10015693mg [Capsella rubella]
MSASTVSLTGNPTAVGKRTPVLSAEKKFNFDFPPSESNANAAIGESYAGTNKDLIHAEAAAERSSSYNVGPVTRKSGSTATGTNTTTTTQRRTRKVQGNKTEKAQWKRVVRVFAKQFGALLVLVGLIQFVRKLALKDTSLSSSNFPIETEMVLSELESRISAVDGLVKTTTKMMQVQVEFLDKKMESESRALRQTIDSSSSALQSELKKIESRTETLQASVDEFNSKPLVSREELERVYEELKKGKVHDSAVNIDELRAYARDLVEKEIGKHASDGLGRVDYALASGGAFVLEHSDPYLVGSGGNWFATSRRRAHSKAVKMLSPSFGEPGQCFPLKGSNGYVLIRLRTPIIPEAVTLEHVSKAVAYDRSSAPKDCRVSGWLEDKDMESETMFRLTEFSYDLDRSNAQTFDIADSAYSGLVNTVRLDFTSNHGSTSHTCIYRFRVHGRELDSVSVVHA